MRLTCKTPSHYPLSKDDRLSHLCVLVDNKQADHPMNNSASFQEGRTAQDTCMNRCEVLLDIVLSLHHALPIKKKGKAYNNN